MPSSQLVEDRFPSIRHACAGICAAALAAAAHFRELIVMLVAPVQGVGQLGGVAGRNASAAVIISHAFDREPQHSVWMTGIPAAADSTTTNGQGS